MPSNPHIKSRCQNFLLNSPSVIAWYPATFCFATISVTHSSVTRSSSSCVIVPSSNAFFAALSFSGLNQLLPSLIFLVLKSFLQNHSEMVSLMYSYIDNLLCFFVRFLGLSYHVTMTLYNTFLLRLVIV